MPSEDYRVLAENPPATGSDTAISFVPEDEDAPCAVIESTGTGRIIAVLPSEREAARVARYAITPDGGYGSVSVELTDKPISHQTFEDWLL